MKLFKLFEVDKQFYIYDTYYNNLTKIDSCLYGLIKDEMRSPLYYQKIKEFEIRDIFNNDCLNMTNCSEVNNYSWKIENEQMALILGLTEECNMMCKYCAYHDYNNRNSIMTKEVIEKALDYFLKKSKFSDEIGISFYGGEPLLKIDLIEHAINYVNKFHLGQVVQYAITTNGLLLSDDYIIDKLIENNFIITISLDGPKLLHDRYRVDLGGNGTFDRIIKNINKLRMKNPNFFNLNVRYNAVIAPPFNNNLLLEFFKKDNVSFIDLIATKEFLKEIENEPNDRIKADYDVNDSPVLLNYIKQLKRYHMIRSDKSGTIIGCAGFCNPFERKIFVNARGKYLLCEKICESNDLYNLGDIYKGINYDKINILINKQKQLYEKNCKKCWAVRLCKACFAYEDEIDYNGRFCKKMRNEVKRDYINYISLINKEPNYLEIFNNMSLD